jgi:hypothetical protein
MIFGFCTISQADEPITADRRCVEHGDLALAPSWAKALAPYPWPERPDGYAYTPPAYLTEYRKKLTDSIGKHRKPSPRKPRQVSASLDAKLRPPKPPKERPAPRTQTVIRCEGCRATVVLKAKAKPTTKFCSDRCRQVVRRAALPVVVPADRTCPVCAAVFTPYAQRGGSGQQTYCTIRCRKRAAMRRYGSPKMAQQGRACIGCGRDNVCHARDGYCHRCAYQQTKAPVRAARAAERPYICCEVCSRPFRPARTGYANRRRWCSEPCRQAAPRDPMRLSGRACVECGRDDVPHRGRGLCDACFQRERRSRKGRAA